MAYGHYHHYHSCHDSRIRSLSSIQSIPTAHRHLFGYLYLLTPPKAASHLPLSSIPSAGHLNTVSARRPQRIRPSPMVEGATFFARNGFGRPTANPNPGTCVSCLDICKARRAEMRGTRLTQGVATVAFTCQFQRNSFFSAAHPCDDAAHHGRADRLALPNQEEEIY